MVSKLLTGCEKYSSATLLKMKYLNFVAQYQSFKIDFIAVLVRYMSVSLGKPQCKDFNVGLSFQELKIVPTKFTL